MQDIDRWTELATAFAIEAPHESAYTSYKLPYQTRPHDQAGGLLRPRGDGERTEALTRLAGHFFRRGHSLQEVEAVCLLWNDTNEPPMPEEKVVSTCESIARSDLRNHPERYAAANDISYHEPWFDPDSARVTRYLTDSPPEREWLVAGLLPQGIVGMVSAPGGSSKSQLLMQLAYDVAQGRAFLARWQVGMPGGVLMLCAEDEVPEIHRRLHWLHKQSGGLDTGAFKRLYIRSTVGERTLLTETAPSGEVELTALVYRLAATARLIPDLRLIVIDPVSRFRGGEENSNEDATRFIEALEFLAKETGATVLVAHHSNKAASNSGEQSQNSARGASALTDGARWHLTLSRPAKDHWIVKIAGEEARATHVELSLVKTNYTAPMAPVLLRRDESGLLQCASTEYAMTEAELPQLSMLARAVHGQPGVTRRQLEQLHFGVGRPGGLSEKAGRALIERAVQLGYLSGQARGPLTVTDKGQELITRTVLPPAAGAARRGKPPRENA